MCLNVLVDGNLFRNYEQLRKLSDFPYQLINLTKLSLLFSTFYFHITAFYYCSIQSIFAVAAEF